MAYDRVPQGVLLGMAQEYGVDGLSLQAFQLLYGQSLVHIAGSKSDLSACHVGWMLSLPSRQGLSQKVFHFSIFISLAEHHLYNQRLNDNMQLNMSYLVRLGR